MGRGVREGVRSAFRTPQTLGKSDSSPGGGSHREFERGETWSVFGFNRSALAVAQSRDGGTKGEAGRPVGELLQRSGRAVMLWCP